MICYVFNLPNSNALNDPSCINTKKIPTDCIQVERLPTSISFNSNKNLIYVTNTNSSTISVIDANTNRVIDTILVEKSPQSVKYIADTNSIYVANFLSSTISVIDANTNRINKSINLKSGDGPVAIEFDPYNKKIYVANYNSSTISVIDANTNRINKSINLPNTDEGPVALLYNPFNKGLYILNKGTSTLDIINTGSNQIISDYPVGNKPLAMTFDIKKNIIYILGKDNIYPIYGTDLVHKILPNTSKAFSDPVDIDINPFSQKLYVTDANKSTYIINLTNNFGIKTISMKYAPEDILVNNKTNTIYESLPEAGFVAAMADIPPTTPVHVTVAYLMSISFIVSLILFSFYIFKKRDKSHLVSNKTKFPKINLNILSSLSNKSIALLSLIIMPSIFVALDEIQLQILQPIIVGNDIYLPKMPLEVLFFNNFLSVIYSSVIILIIVVYPPYPFFKSLYEYYENIGFKECVKENELIKKTLWISIPILILVTIYPYVNIILEKYFAISILKIEQNPVYIIVEVMSLFIVLSGVSKITITTFFRKEFFLCLSKGYFECIKIDDTKTLSNQSEDIKNLVKGLEAYNEYMIKIFNRKINDIDRIIKIIMISNEYDEKVKEISLKFQETTNVNALEPLKAILKYSISKSKSEDQQEPELFLVNKTIREKFSGTAVFLTTMLIPLTIAIIELFQKVK